MVKIVPVNNCPCCIRDVDAIPACGEKPRSGLNESAYNLGDGRLDGWIFEGERA